MRTSPRNLSMQYVRRTRTYCLAQRGGQLRLLWRARRSVLERCVRGPDDSVGQPVHPDPFRTATWIQPVSNDVRLAGLSRLSTSTPAPYAAQNKIPLPGSLETAVGTDHDVANRNHRFTGGPLPRPGCGSNRSNRAILRGQPSIHGDSARGARL